MTRHRALGVVPPYGRKRDGSPAWCSADLVQSAERPRRFSMATHVDSDSRSCRTNAHRLPSAEVRTDGTDEVAKCAAQSAGWTGTCVALPAI